MRLDYSSVRGYNNVENKQKEKKVLEVEWIKSEVEEEVVKEKRKKHNKLVEGKQKQIIKLKLYLLKPKYLAYSLEILEFLNKANAWIVVIRVSSMFCRTLVFTTGPLDGYQCQTLHVASCNKH